MTFAKFKKETHKKAQKCSFRLDDIENSKKANTVDTDNGSKKYAKIRTETIRT